MMKTALTCRFCDSPAVIHVMLDRGCVCYPDERDQWLCRQHYLRATPIGGMEVIEVLE